MQTNKSGFGLLEIMIAIAIMALAGSVAIINYNQQRKKNQMRTFLGSLNTVVGQAWQQAIASNTVHRVFFDMKKRHVLVEKKVSDTSDKTDTQEHFQPVRLKALGTFYEWPEIFVIRRFFINGKQEAADRVLNEVWFYIMPDGTAQQVTIDVAKFDSPEQETEKAMMMLVLNPFIPQFKVDETGR